MQYVPYECLNKDVSRLGFGCMRLPTIKQGEENVIDREKAISMIRYGIDSGINYVDTAFGYHRGDSEVLVGEALKNGYREKVTLTTKLPPWNVNEPGDLDKVLDTQLKRLDLPYVDFYILHAMNKDVYEKLTALNFKDFYRRALRDGRIKHTGFSFHDDKETFLKILHDYDFELAQVQFNYLDLFDQATIDGVIEAGRIGTGVVVMEPLRGGALANPPAQIRKLIEDNPHGWSPVEWALRYVANRPEVKVILSGMSNMDQVQDNLRIFSQADVIPGGLTEEDLAFTDLLRSEYKKRIPIPCTGCEYCQPCPMGVKIPALFSDYNEAYMLDNMKDFVWGYEGKIKKEQDASRCVQCKKCESVCPQHIQITSLLGQLQKAYEENK